MLWSLQWQKQDQRNFASSSLLFARNLDVASFLFNRLILDASKSDQSLNDVRLQKHLFIFASLPVNGKRHAFKIDFRCFWSSSQIYEEINLMGNINRSSCMKIYLKYFVLHGKRVILHIHQQDKPNILNGEHKNKNWEHCTEIFLKEQQQSILEREELKYQKENV